MHNTITNHNQAVKHASHATINYHSDNMYCLISGLRQGINFRITADFL